MINAKLVQGFSEAATRVGAKVLPVGDVAAAADYIHTHAGGLAMLGPSPSLERLGLARELRQRGSEIATGKLRAEGPAAAAGITGSNFAIADTGTIVLESTNEALRLATTLPERHFALLDPCKIVADGLEAVPLLRRLQQQTPRSFLAYISGPSRTADIERVLTIGVHGPCELHVLLLEGLSDDFIEN
ncbi:lactate utilization protein [Geoalkalibacter subterraneus]|jgi:L-lactate dehydrogenase complex protein LldG|uniref:lactate utilization protein n=1 Tax=Geoalkalibacter subterraneus TaxID=483547 RepID=UPI00069344C4|nr:lactate utilization protein [Geoalkalibacter subterraneus]